MEELLKQLLNEVKDLKQRTATKEDINAIQCEISQIKQEVSAIKQEMGTKVQQHENTDMIKAILHNQEASNAKLEFLTLNTATHEHVVRMEAKFDCLNDRLFNQEAELRQLKAVK